MGYQRNWLPGIIRVPSVRDILYRLPWSVGLVCSGYLLLGLRMAGNTSLQAARGWSEGFFWQSHFTASLLLYSLLLCVVAAILGARRRRDIPGVLLILAYLFVLWLFQYCFVHKTQGYVIWPMAT
jgi:hypothetical protein